jgi:hypothetical protein
MRTAIHCPNCRQLNLRYHGSKGYLLNPRRPECCTICGTDLKTGRRGAFGRVRAVFMWTTLYSIHAFIGGALIIPVALFYPDLMRQPMQVRVALLVVGIGLGLLAAEQSRRRGSLLHRSGRRRRRK